MLSQPLVSAAALAGALTDSSLVIIDCRHELQDPEAGLRKFHAGHIPGSCHAHLDRDLSRPPRATEGRHPLPSVEQVAGTFRRLGICNDSFVVVYDDCGGAMAARLWWMLRWLGHEQVAVLDGGIQAWSALDVELEPGPIQALAVGDFVAKKAQDSWIVTTSELTELLAQGEISLLDARARPRFDGLVEPIDPVAGHIPGAVNLPFSELLSENGTFLSPVELAELFAEALGGRSVEEAISMCGSGVTACHLQLGLEIAGLGIGRVYVGSWSEWVRDVDRPVATG